LSSIGYGAPMLLMDASSLRLSADDNYWSQNTAKIKFIGMRKRDGQLKGKKIVNLYHDSAYGKETIQS